MKVLIIEDEQPAAEKLIRYLNKYDESIEILQQLDSVESSTQWLTNHQEQLDLIFMDIQLIDGLSFEIFDAIKITRPVIFTTAFDEYAIDAFKVNGIDYLLKPITYTNLQQSLKKIDALRSALGEVGSINQKVQDINQKKYKNRFMVKLGEHIRSITTDEIVLFYAEGRNVYIYTDKNRKFILDNKLEELENMLDPAFFFRVNRSFILNINCITDVLVYSNSRLKITPSLDIQKEIIVSREKVGAFKEWFDGASE